MVNTFLIGVRFMIWYCGEECALYFLALYLWIVLRPYSYMKMLCIYRYIDISNTTHNVCLSILVDTAISGKWLNSKQLKMCLACQEQLNGIARFANSSPEVIWNEWLYFMTAVNKNYILDIYRLIIPYQW